MKHGKQVRLTLLLLLCAIPCSAQDIDTITIRAHTRFLSSDALEGRGTGSRGEHIAGLYVASQLMRMGAQPVAGNDYFLPIPLKRAIIDDSATAITLRGQAYRSTRDFAWHTGGRGALRSFSGPLVYVGAPDSVAASRISTTTRGAVVVTAGPLGAAASTFVPALIAAGAAGLVILVPDSATFDLFVRSRGPARYYLDANVNDPVWQAELPTVIAGPTLARAIAPDSQAARFTAIPDLFRATFRAVVEDVESANLAGVIRGSNPQLASQYVAFSAHYDHLGISTPDARGDSIYNGFSDDAAGVAMVLAIGDAFHRQRPERSILLLFFTGEERGLLGSSYYAAKPPIPIQRITGLINLDGGAPPAPPVDWRIAGGTASPLGETAKAALAAHSWQATLTAASPNSDYWPFLARGVNAVFIIPGNHWEGVTEPQQRALRARWDRYHQAADEWAPDFPFSGLKRYAEAALAIGRVLANPHQ